jgi:hypothetical protein
MSSSKKLRIALIALFSFICLAGVSLWIYLTYTFVVFAPLEFNDKKELVPAETDNEFYKNLRVVLAYEHVKYQLDGMDHAWIPLKVAIDRELIRSLTEKAMDVVWLYEHKKEKHPSFPCKGDGYGGFVFEKEFSSDEHWGGDSGVNIDLTCTDVALAEEILKDSIKAVGGIDKWHIEFKLTRYFRQYFGYRNASGDVCIHIEFTLKRASMSVLQDDIIGMKDGGSSFWRADINLTDKKVEGVSVNGGA